MWCLTWAILLWFFILFLWNFLLHLTLLSNLLCGALLLTYLWNTWVWVFNLQSSSHCTFTLLSSFQSPPWNSTFWLRLLRCYYFTYCWWLWLIVYSFANHLFLILEKFTSPCNCHLWLSSFQCLYLWPWIWFHVRNDTPLRRQTNRITLFWSFLQIRQNLLFQWFFLILRFPNEFLFILETHSSIQLTTWRRGEVHTPKLSTLSFS